MESTRNKSLATKMSRKDQLLQEKETNEEYQQIKKIRGEQAERQKKIS